MEAITIKQGLFVYLEIVFIQIAPISMMVAVKGRLNFLIRKPGLGIAGDDGPAQKKPWDGNVVEIRVVHVRTQAGLLEGKFLTPATCHTVSEIGIDVAFKKYRCVVECI